ncbi:hypothetical protein EHN07_16140 [Buttiauxella warmboldiae]|uniref:Uncharacterized protein n=1 Tax=Buttiauxella warmboldiae TaxID=82993 RepID=A0A3N5DPP1_9ENTR|nr:hypothetical protein [Buttiauxella warmboldiae]RPH23339.1 hypothetical protein EHN07_16140 [Buttiauxella warmboldiae]
MKDYKKIILVLLLVLGGVHFMVRFSDMDIGIKIIYLIGAIMTLVIAITWAHGGFQWSMAAALLVLVAIDFFIGALMFLAAEVPLHALKDNYHLIAQTILSEAVRVWIFNWLFSEVREQLDKRIVIASVIG